MDLSWLAVADLHILDEPYTLMVPTKTAEGERSIINNPIQDSSTKSVQIVSGTSTTTFSTSDKHTKANADTDDTNDNYYF